MKSKILPLLAVFLISLVSCSALNIASSSSKEVGVYNLDKLGEEESIDNAYDMVIEPRFKKNEPYIPYITLKQYASLYESHFHDGVESQYNKTSTSVTWSLYRNDNLYFIAEINFISKTVRTAGAISSAIKSDSTKDLKALSYGANTRYEADYLSGNGYAEYSFGNQRIKYFSYNNNFYISLGFLDMTFSSDSGIYFYYNYQRIVSTSEADYLAEKSYKVGEKLTNVNQEMTEVVGKQTMPQYLRNYNAYLFLYFLDNFYGLKKEKGLTSATNYCKKLGVYNSLFSTNNEIRVQAIADALSYLDDNHTALISGFSAWGEEIFTRWTYGDGCKKRSALNKQLTDTRKTVYDNLSLVPGTDIVYSNDGKTAMFMFDHFSFGTSEQVFNSDDSIKDTAYLYDTFCSLIRAFNILKNKGGVENVILDISTNGGGTVGVMMKILSLITAYNTSNIYYLDSSFQELDIATTKIDINNDHQYDTEDCFGDDFNIAIMTSDCSFSAANAFACNASYQSIAPIIGQKPGGGECAVGIHYLPNGEYIYHSSSLHLGYYDTDFVGFESGVKPVLEIENIDDMYDIEYLNQHVPACFQTKITIY